MEEKIKLMSPNEIILSMINSLKNNHVILDINSFGHHLDGECFGDVSICVLSEISGKKFTPENIGTLVNRMKLLGLSMLFLSKLGHLYSYNLHAKSIGITLMPNYKGGVLPNFYENEGIFEEFANQEEMFKIK